MPIRSLRPAQAHRRAWSIPRDAKHTSAALLAGFFVLLGCLGAQSSGEKPRSNATDPDPRGLSQAEQESLRFLREHMPPADRELLSAAQLMENVALAHGARAEFPWGTSVPLELFRNYVLPYAQAEEARENWRKPMLARCRPLVQGCTTLEQAARALNEKLFDLVGVHYSTKRRRALQAPSESMAQGAATCTGLSILLADACRAVGVPARLVSVRWPHRRGNHTWVEVWDGAAWRFCGADEPDPKGLDRAWFVGDASKCHDADPEHRVWAVSFAKTDTRFASGWGRTKLWGTDETARYALAGTTAQGGAKAQPASDQDAALLAQLARYFAADPKRQRTFEFDRNLDAELKTKAGDSRLRALAWRALRAHERKQLLADHEANRVRAGGKESPFTVKRVGEKPAGGWPLVIAMHGGGGVPQRVNDSQWRHMQIYYKDHPEVGGYLYCALRAPTDEWNGFYTDYFYPVLERLIRQFVVCDGVDPGRVIALGYSHGGYGAFAIGPKLPHRFAAVHASAAAPTAGQSSPIGLHSLRFSFMVGGRDTAYGRRTRCEAFAAELEKLQARFPGRYPTEFTLVPNNGHGGLPDRDLLAKLVPIQRVAMPMRLRWRMTDKTVTTHYWLHVEQPRTGVELESELRTEEGEGSTWLLDGGGDASAQAWLDARWVDMQRPLRLATAAGKEKRRDVPAPSLRTLCQTMQASGDPWLAASWVVPYRGTAR